MGKPLQRCAGAKRAVLVDQMEGYQPEFCVLPCNMHGPKSCIRPARCGILDHGALTGLGASRAGFTAEPQVLFL